MKGLVSVWDTLAYVYAIRLGRNQARRPFSGIHGEDSKTDCVRQHV
jgi:hypothetical protein